jgi:hypothetical protein
MSPPFLCVERRAGGEEAGSGRQRLLSSPYQGAHVVFLAQRHHHRAADPHVVEGRVQVVHAEAADVAERIGDVDGDVRLRRSTGTRSGIGSPTSRSRRSAARRRRWRGRA